MKTRSITIAALCAMLAACLAGAPTAYADEAQDTSLAAGTVAEQTTPTAVTTTTAAAATTAAKAAPKQSAAPKSVKVKSPAKGKVKVSWKAAKVSGSKAGSYTVRWSYKKSMASAKKKTVKSKSVTLKNLKKGKKVYVQVRANAKVKGKAVHTKWSSAKSVTVKPKKQAAFTSLKPQIKNIARWRHSTDLWVTVKAINHPAVAKWDFSKPSSKQLKTYTVRWSYDKSMKNAKSASDFYGVDIEDNLALGKTVYIQARVNGKVNGKTVHTKWSDVKSYTMPKELEPRGTIIGL